MRPFKVHYALLNLNQRLLRDYGTQAEVKGKEFKLIQFRKLVVV
jgi:hypothetical protein